MSDTTMRFTGLPAAASMVPHVRTDQAVRNGQMASQQQEPVSGGDDPSAAAPRRPWWTSAVAAAALGAVVGGGLGWSVANAAGPSVSATALVQVAPTADPRLSGVQQNVITGGDAQAFASSELTYLSSVGFSEAAAQRAGVEPDAVVEASRVGQSTVISLSATEPDADSAIRLLNGAMAVYNDGRSAALKAQTDAALKSVDDTLTQVSTSPLALTDPDAQQARVERLLGQRDSLQILANQNVKAITVVEGATVDDQAIPNWAVGTALGAVIGALVAFGLVRAITRRRDGI